MFVLINFALFVMFFIILLILSSRKFVIKNRYIKPSSKTKIINKQTNVIKSKYPNLTHFELRYIDKIISDLKDNKNLILQSSNWKIMPNSFLFLTKKNELKVNNKIYSIINNVFPLICFISEQVGNKIEESIFFAKIDDMIIDDLITYNKQTYAILTQKRYIRFYINENAKSEIEIEFINLLEENANFEINIQLNKFDYYSVKRNGLNIYLIGEILKDKYLICSADEINVMVKGKYIYLKTTKSQKVKIRKLNNYDDNIDFKSGSLILNEYYSYLNLKPFCSRLFLINNFLKSIGIEFKNGYIFVNQIPLKKDFGFLHLEIEFKFVYEEKLEQLVFLIEDRKIVGTNYFKLSNLRNKKLTIIYY